MNTLIFHTDDSTRQLLRSYVGKTNDMILYSVYADAEKAIEVLTTQRIDIAFVDIKILSFINNFQVLERVPHKPAVIIIAESREDAMDAFDVNAVDCLLRSTTYIRFLRAVVKVKALQDKDGPQLKNDQLCFKVCPPNSSPEIVSISRKEILFVKSVGDYLQIVTTLKTYVTLGTLMNMESKLSRKEFMKIHRSFLVRLDKIEKIRDNEVQIAGNDIPLARSFKKELLSWFDMV